MIGYNEAMSTNEMRDPVVISDGDKVALSTCLQWNLVYDEAIWSCLAPNTLPKMLGEMINRHTWINVWNISKQSLEVGNGWCIIRFDEDHASGLVQYVSFEYNDGEREFAWPFYYRGSNNELVKVVPDSPFYDRFRGYYDNGMFFTLEEVRKSWGDIYRHFASGKVKRLLAPMIVRMDW